MYNRPTSPYFTWRLAIILELGGGGLRCGSRHGKRCEGQELLACAASASTDGDGSQDMDIKEHRIGRPTEPQRYQ